MAENGDLLSRVRRRPYLWIALGAFVFAGLLPLALWAMNQTSKPKPPQNQQLADAAAISAQIASACSMGHATSEEESVNTRLGNYLSGLSSGAKVTTSDVGALVDKITPNDQGLAFYRAYTDCLKQQSAILLNQRGVTLVAPAALDVEAQRDEQVREEIADISPTVPKPRLVELFGQPVATGHDENMEDDVAADFYQYKHMLFVGDYYKKGKRIGLVFATKDPIQGAAMFFDQIRGVTLGSVKEDCGGFETTAHADGRTGICLASHATAYVKKVFFFDDLFETGAQVDADDKCSSFALDTDFVESVKFDPHHCPGLASVPALAVAIAKDEVPDDDFMKAADSWLNSSDFGGSVSWRSEKEDAAMEARSKAEENLNSDQMKQLDLARRAERNKKLGLAITPAI